MTDEEGAAILFAETRDWRPDPRDVDQVRHARLALARGILANEGRGFLAGVGATPADFGDPETLAAWQDCFAAVRAARASTGSQNLGFFVGHNPPGEDNALRQKAPALKIAVATEEFGPFLLDGGGAPVKLYVYEGVEGLGPGFMPFHGAIEQKVKNNYFRNPFLATGIVVACLAIFVGISFCAFYDGKDASRDLVSPERLAQRMADTIKRAEPRLSDDADSIARQIVRDASLLPHGRQTWWETTDSGGAVKLTGGASTAEIDTLARNAYQVIDQRVPAASALSALDETQVNSIREDVAVAINQAIRSDPIIAPTFVNLAAWWFAAIATLTIVAGVVGKGFYGSVLGVLIDSRNRLSLSRLQLLFWSVLVLSLFSVTSIFLIGATDTTGVLPQYPWTIWALLGISIGTAPLSGLILLNKSTQEAQPNAERSIEADPTATNVGRVEVKLKEYGWSFLDFFRGEEIANRNEIDISRFQYFVITLVLMIIFTGLVTSELWTLHAGQDWLTWAKNKSYPHLNETFIALLALSHGSYLGMKLLAKPDVTAGR